MREPYQLAATVRQSRCVYLKAFAALGDACIGMFGFCKDKTRSNKGADAFAFQNDGRDYPLHARMALHKKRHGICGRYIVNPIFVIPDARFGGIAYHKGIAQGLIGALRRADPHMMTVGADKSDQ